MLLLYITSQSSLELSASRLKEKNVLHLKTKITFYCVREKTILLPFLYKYILYFVIMSDFLKEHEFSK